MSDFVKKMQGDYSGAEVSLAWAIKDRRLHLLFARIDLLPKEFPPEIDTPKVSKQIGDGWSVGFQKVYRTVDEALRFYEAIRDGQLIDICDSRKPVDAILASRCEKDVYPCLRIAPVREREGGPPYFAGWQTCPRYHETLAQDPERVGFVSESTKAAKAAGWLSPFISFDLTKFREYWGGAVLIAPNPLFRSVEERLWPNPEDTSQESVLIRLHPRRGQSFSGLKVTCSEAETGVSTEKPFVMELAILDFDHRVGKVATTIHCPERGLVYTTEPLSFIRSIHGTIDVLSHNVKLKIEDKIRNKTREVEARSVTRTETLVGEVHAPSFQDREEQRRLRQGEATKYDQIWFDAGRFTDEPQQLAEIERAREYIRRRLNQARQIAWIVDPYFGALDFLTFFGAVQDWSVPIKILTSAEFLRCKRGDVGDREGDALLKTQQDLKEHLSKRGAKFPSYEIRVMPGEKAAIHDRFIIADQEVWAIGSSFNEFGSRGSLALRLPDSEPVIKAVEKVWSDQNILSFSDWMARRVSQVGNGVEGGKNP